MKKRNSLEQIRYKKWELRKAILEIILLSCVTGGTIRRPLLPLMVKTIIKLLKEHKKLNIEEQKVKRVLSNLEKSNIISLVENKDEVYVQAVNQNKPIVIKHSIKLLLDFKKKKWDGKWFLVFFDVPEIQRNKRDYLRKFLRQLGFYPYQKSVYIFPYACEKEVSLIKKIVEGAKYMKYIVAEKIEDEDMIKKFFKL